MQYVSKPSVIEAVQWTGDNKDEVEEFGQGKVQVMTVPETRCSLLAGKDGAQEWVPVPVSHWLVNVPGDKSDIWPVDPDYFAGKYVTHDKGNEDDGYTLGDMREFGLLWLLNTTCLHPRGFAIGVNPDGSDWKLFGDGTQPWSYLTKEIVEIAIAAGADRAKLPPYPIDDGAAFMAVEHLLDMHRVSPEE
jgi:hypothetical protein